MVWKAGRAVAVVVVMMVVVARRRRVMSDERVNIRGVLVGGSMAVVVGR